MSHVPGHLTPEEEEALRRAREGGDEDDRGLQQGDTVFGFREDGSRIRLQVGIGNNGRITLFDPETGQVFLGVGGQFLTTDNKVFEIDQQGNLVSAPRTLTDRERRALGLGVGGDTGGTAARPFGSTEQEQRFLTDEQIRLQEHIAELQERDRQLQAELVEAQAARDWERQRQLQDALHQNNLELLALQQEFQSGEREAGQEFQAEESALGREQQLRVGAMQELGAARRQLLSVQERANQWLAETQGRDPLRAAIRMQGGLQLGTTPMQGWRQQLQQILNQQIPQVDIQGPIQDITGAVAGLEQAAQLPQRPTLGAPMQGMAKGGTIDMKKGKDGTFAVLVGEAGPEVLQIDEKQVKVVPLLGRAQGGLTIGRNQRPALGTKGLGAATARRPAARTQTILAPPPQRPAAPQPTLAPSVQPPTRPTLAPSLTARAPSAVTTLRRPPSLLGRPTTLGTPGEDERFGEGPGQEVPGPGPRGPEAEIDFLDDLVSRWPNIGPLDAQEALWLGLTDLAQTILDFDAGVLTEAQAVQAFQGMGLGIQAPPTGDFDVGTIRQAIETLWRHLGMDPMGGLGTLGGTTIAQPELLGELGVQQRLYRNAETGQVFLWREGELHAMTTPGFASAAQLRGLGVQPQDVATVSPDFLTQLGIGDPLYWGANSPTLGEMTAMPDVPFPLLASSLVEPNTGLALPLPRAIASLWGRLDPATQSVIMSAFGLAGVDEGSFQREMQFFTPTGTGQAGGVRFG